MKNIHPYLNFNGNAEEVFRFYQSVFGGELSLVRFSEMNAGADFPADIANWLAHVSLPLVGGQQLMGSDTPPDYAVQVSPAPNFSIHLEMSDAAEAHRIFDALSADGQIRMPLGKTSWAELFGMVTDKFATPWMMAV